VLSLIRFTPPRHAVRRDTRGVVRHPATKVVAAPLVTATAVVAMDSNDTASSPQAHVAASHTALPTASRWSRSFLRVTQSTVPAPSTTTIVVPPSTTSTTGTTTHLWPTSTPPSPASAPLRLAPAKAPARPSARPSAPARVPPRAPIGGTPPAAAITKPRTAKTVPLGDFAGSGNPQALANFASITGTHPVLASDYLLRTSGWDGMDGAGGSEDWMFNQWRNSGYRLVLGVPILPGGSGGTLAQGATGAYNTYFTTLAQTLVHDGASNAILRLGWEFNGTWYPWSVASNTDAQNFAAFWRQIVTAMRAVPGQQFKFLWNPNGGGTSGWDLTLAYPGSAYVDYLGTDVYDQYWGSSPTPHLSWGNAVTQTWGLNWLVSFAAAQGRPIAIPEWSVDYRNDGHGMGDDANFINQFSNWIAANNVAFTCIFSYNDTAGGQDNDITDGSFPNALAAFRTDF
jgi:Glycosyl hydrolase family 26